jgi:hypothetical protein
MDPVRNPYRTNAGAVPPDLVGRDGNGLTITGLGGVGKAGLRTLIRPTLLEVSPAERERGALRAS